MGKYNYLVFGSGRQGIAVVVDLIKNCEAKEITVVDPDQEQLLKCGDIVADLDDQYDFSITYRQAVQKDARNMILPHNHYDVILSCAPYQVNLELTKMAINSNIPYCDLGGNPEVVQQQRWHCEPFENEGCCPAVVPDCGVSPGISNVLAVRFAKQGYDIIRVRCGGVFDGFVDNPLNYELLFSPDGLISEYSGECPTIVDGRLVMEETVDYVEPFLHDRLHSDIMSYEVGFECAHTSNNSVEVVEYLKEIGVKHYDYMTVRDRGHWNKIRVLKELGYCYGNRKKDEELIEMLSRKDFERKNPDILFLMVKGGKVGGSISEQKELTIMHFGYPNNFSAMEEMTAWGITTVAYHIVSGLGKPKGFATPERFVDGGWMIEELNKRLR